MQSITVAHITLAKGENAGHKKIKGIHRQFVATTSIACSSLYVFLRHEERTTVATEA